jgi:flagellar motor switch protein FliM
MRELSQDEIDSVFKGAEGGQAQVKAIPYDFRKPDRIPKSQMHSIRFLLENFVRTLVSSFTAYLRSYISGNLISLEQVPYAEFLEVLPTPTCLVSLTLKPSGGHAVLELNPSLIFPILELVLGGKERYAKNLSRELTELERHLLDRVYRIILHDLTNTWRGVADVEFTMESDEGGRQLLGALAPGEAVLAIGIEFRIGENTGMINLAIPSLIVKSMVQRFDKQWSAQALEVDEVEEKQTLNLLFKAGVELEAQIKATIRARDFLRLTEGSVLVLGHPADGLIACALNDKWKYDAMVGSAGTHRAVRIESLHSV